MPSIVSCILTKVKIHDVATRQSGRVFGKTEDFQVLATTEFRISVPAPPLIGMSKIAVDTPGPTLQRFATASCTNATAIATVAAFTVVIATANVAGPVTFLRFGVFRPPPGPTETSPENDRTTDLTPREFPLTTAAHLRHSRALTSINNLIANLRISVESLAHHRLPHVIGHVHGSQTKHTSSPWSSQAIPTLASMALRNRHSTKWYLRTLHTQSK